jgi:hypothetical protein
MFNFGDILVKEPDILHKTPSPFMIKPRLVPPEIKKEASNEFCSEDKTHISCQIHFSGNSAVYKRITKNTAEPDRV